MWWWPNILYIFLPNCWSRQGTIWERSNRSWCQWLTHGYRAVTSFFCNRGHYREYRRHEACGGVWGYRPPENFHIWRLRNVIFSTYHEIFLRKIDLEYENGKQLQVTITKITESKENKSIHRLDVSGSTGPGGKLSLLAPSLATALDYILNNEQLRF